MSDEILNILSDNNPGLDANKIADYLNDKLPPAEKHEVEKAFSEAGIESDAIEGLQEFKSPKDAIALADQLNKKLQQQLAEKRNQKQSKKPSNLYWLYLAIILIVVIIVIAFFLIQRFLQS